MRLLQSVRLLVLMAVAVGLFGCSNNPNPAPLHATRPDGSPWVVRYWGMPDEPKSLDPQYAYEETSKRVLEPIYDCLLEYNPFKTDPYELQPCLLTEMPQRSDGPNGSVVYLCTLKRGVRFHDDRCFPGGIGRELVAKDFLYALQRIADPKVECPIFSTLADCLPGMTEAAAAAKGKPFDYSQPLACFEPLDDYTFKLHLSKPYPQILYWMAMNFLSPVPREAIAYYDGAAHPGEAESRPQFRWHPVGTGPFRMAEYTPGQRVRLERNPHYTTTKFPTGGWPAESESLLRPLAGQPLPIVDEVQISIFREALPIWVLTRQGYIDSMGVGKDAFNSVISQSRELTPKYRDRGMILEKDVEPSTYYISFNTQDPVMKNKKLRQALSCAFDAEAMIDIFYNGVPTKAEQLLPPGVSGFRKELRNPYGHSLEKARKLLAEAGYPDGRDPQTGYPLKLRFDVVASGGDERQMAEFEQAQFQQLGIQVEVVENNFPRMLQKEDEGNFQMASGTGWGADYPDPENFFFLFYSKNFPPAGKNISRYSSPEFDANFEKMSNMDNSPERSAIVDKMNDILLEDAPILLLFNRGLYAMVQPWAPRTQRNAMLEGGLKYAYVNASMRTEKQKEWNTRPVWPLSALAIGVVGLASYGVTWNRKRHV